MNKRSRALLYFLGIVTIACLIFWIGITIQTPDQEPDRKKQKVFIKAKWGQVQPEKEKEIALKHKALFEKKSRSVGIVIGTPADDVLAIRGKAPYPAKVIGEDENGLIVEWEYPNGIYVMKRWTINGITCYRVAEMK